MTKRSRRRSTGMDWLGLVSFGFFLMLVGAVWLTTPHLSDEATSFANDFTMQNVTGSIVFPAPKNVYDHTVVYTAAMWFCIAFAVSEIVILVLRFTLHESVERTAGSVSGIAFWFSTGYFLSLLANRSIGWFSLIAGIIIAAGLAIIATSIVKLFR